MDGIGLVHIGNLLAAGQQIVCAKGILMIHNPPVMAAGNEPHTTSFNRHIAQRDPRRDLAVGFAHTPIGQILMPGHGFVRSCLFDKKLDRPDQQVGAKHPFDRVQYRRRPGQIRQKRDHQMTVHAEELVQVMPAPAICMVTLQGFNLMPGFGDMCRIEHTDAG